MSNASKKCKRVNSEKAVSWGITFLNEMCSKTYITYACTSISFNLIPQKSAQESIQELISK